MKTRLARLRLLATASLLCAIATAHAHAATNTANAATNTASATTAAATATPARPFAATLTIHAGQNGPVINRNIYGQFTEHLGHCIYEGIWVGENSPIPNTRGIRNDVAAALRNLRVPVLRWPGGCFADEYHWKNGIGPREKRPATINTHWGGVIENNNFGTHEFMDLCEQIGAEPYICGNLGSGTEREMMDWIEYITSDADSTLANLRRANGRDKPWPLHYFGVGNESWGCGGNMRPEYYADLFRRYNTFVKNYPGNKIYRIACGANADNFNWTDVLMKNAARQMDGLSLHYYTLPTGNWGKKGSATDFDEPAYAATLKRALHIDDLLAAHAAIMDKYDPRKRIGLVVDEWGVWTDPEPGTNPGFLHQQNSLRDALAAALTLHAFQAHADRVVMANISQTINVVHSMILTNNEKMLLTPTYHVFEMFKVHQGATSLPLTLATPDYVCGSEKLPAVSASASRDETGALHLSLVNANPTSPAALTCVLDGLDANGAGSTGAGGGANVTGAPPKTVTGRVLTAPAINSINTFEAPRTVEPKPFDGARFTGDKPKTLLVTLPPKSIVVLEIK